jgi:hypothetical protein
MGSLQFPRAHGHKSLGEDRFYSLNILKIPNLHLPQTIRKRLKNNET